MLYEKWVETFVWLFVPFYSEIKSLFILFFLLTRAKVGTDPRAPVVKDLIDRFLSTRRAQSLSSCTSYGPSSSPTPCLWMPFVTRRPRLAI